MEIINYNFVDSAINSSSINIIEAQKLIQVIYEVLRSVKWHKISRKLIDRLIFMLESSISPKEDSEHIIYEPLKLGIDLCIRHVINNMSNNDVMVMVSTFGLIWKIVINNLLLAQKVIEEDGRRRCNRGNHVKLWKPFIIRCCQLQDEVLLRQHHTRAFDGHIVTRP